MSSGTQNRSFSKSGKKLLFDVNRRNMYQFLDGVKRPDHSLLSLRQGGTVISQRGKSQRHSENVLCHDDILCFMTKHWINVKNYENMEKYLNYVYKHEDLRKKVISKIKAELRNVSQSIPSLKDVHSVKKFVQTICSKQDDPDSYQKLLSRVFRIITNSVNKFGRTNDLQRQFHHNVPQICLRPSPKYDVRVLILCAIGPTGNDETRDIWSSIVKKENPGKRIGVWATSLDGTNTDITRENWNSQFGSTTFHYIISDYCDKRLLHRQNFQNGLKSLLCDDGTFIVLDGSTIEIFKNSPDLSSRIKSQIEIRTLSTKRMKCCIDPSYNPLDPVDFIVHCFQNGQKLAALVSLTREIKAHLLEQMPSVVVVDPKFEHQVYINKSVYNAYWSALREKGITDHPNMLTPPSAYGDAINGFLFGYNVWDILQYIYVGYALDSTMLDTALTKLYEKMTRESVSYDEFRRRMTIIIKYNTPKMETIGRAIEVIKDAATTLLKYLPEDPDMTDIPVMRNLRYGASL